MAATIIALMQNKGGVAKTTTTAVLCTERALAGDRALGIDWDKTNPSLTEMLLTDEEVAEELDDPQLSAARLITQCQAGIGGLIRVVDLSFDALHRGVPRYPVTQLRAVAAERGWHPTGRGAFHFIPGHTALGEALDALATSAGGRIPRDHYLAQALSAARNQYDWIVIDMGPGSTSSDLGRLNVLALADAVIVPLNFTLFAEKAAKADLKALARYNDERISEGGVPVQVAGIALYKYDPGDRLHAEKLAAYRRSSLLRPYLLQTIVPEDRLVEKAQEAGVPPQLFAPLSPASVAYHDLDAEIVARLAALLGPWHRSGGAAGVG